MARPIFGLYFQHDSLCVGKYNKEGSNFVKSIDIGKLDAVQNSFLKGASKSK